MTIRTAYIIQWMFLFSCATSTVAVGLGEACTNLDECVTANSTCVEDVCRCFPSYAEVNNTCVLSECGQLEPILNGVVTVTFNDTTQSFVAAYSCNLGFQLQGVASRICTPSNFDGTAPTCQPKECSPLPSLVNGDIAYSANPPTVGSNASFSCNDGFELNGTSSVTCLTSGNFEDYSTTCDDIDECSATGQNSCDGNATCTNTPGSFFCNCNPGYSGDGIQCQDIDECSPTGQNNCDSNATCTNTEGSFVCNCNPGFSGNGTECQDIDECSPTGQNNCDSNATCTNIPGSFVCNCNPGFSGNGTECQDIDECSPPGQNNCDSNATCTNIPGSFVCNCNPGFNGNGTECQDIDECSPTGQNNCDSNATCTNIPGSFVCNCNPGFSGNGTECQDIDECSPPGQNNCDSNATCTNIPGSFVCNCNPGFNGNGTECQDIDECSPPGQNNCDSNATCTNIPGSFVCNCNPGFNGNGTECQVDPPVVCQSQLTKNVYIELSPSLDEQSICLLKNNTSEDDICHNPSEAIVYQYAGSTFTVQENATQFCVLYNGDPIPLICDNITAFDGSITENSATTELCFLFNREPVFVGPMTLSFNVPDMGSEQIVALTGTDPDSHQNLSILTTGVQPTSFGSVISIDDNELTILNPNSIIQEAADVIITVEVGDDGRPSLQTEANITVQFTFTQLSCSPSQDPFLVHLNPAPTSPSQIGQIDCVNVTQNQGLSFSVQDISGPFTITEMGVLFYNESASTVTSGEFTATVTAEIQQPVFTNATVTVYIIADDFSPACDMQGTGISQFDENDMAGTCYDTVYICMEKAGVLETCNGETDLFNITCENVSSNTTEVKVCLKMDLINKYGNYSISGTITNQYGSTPLNLDVGVANVNNPPIIQKIASSYNLSEDSPAGTDVAVFNVTDPDIGYTPPIDSLSANISYTDDSLEAIPFTVSLNDAQDKITLTLSAAINYVVKPNYSLELTVFDEGGLSDFILITINILNVNEPPTCTELQVSAIASVQQAPGTVIATLTCSDPDLDALTYDLNGPQNIISNFQVNNSGVVSIKNQLLEFTDENTVLQFGVIVADFTGLQVEVNISVEISNSVPPQCQTLAYSTSKSEKTDINVCFTVPTDCQEPVQNEALMFEFLTGNGTQLFRTEPNENQNNDLRVCTEQNLQNSYGIWLINIAVKSSYGEGNIVLTISVNDQNDPPVFTNLPVTFNITENTPVGTLLFAIIAQDPDSGILSEITYQSTFVDGTGLEDSPLFTLNRTSGVVRTKSTIDADSSTVQGSYTFTIKAVDGALQQPKSAISTLTINILDVNDNPPVCSVDNDTVTVLLTLPVGGTVYQLSCQDNDRTLAYRQLEYSITSNMEDLFDINENGTIMLLQSLSRDITEYTISVLVTDQDNTSFNDTVEVTVSINTAIPPSCSPAEISSTLRETQPEGTCLDVEVRCTDPTGGQLRVGSASGSGAGILEIRRTGGTGSIGINACTNSTLRNKFGTYELIGTISSDFAQTFVKWTLTVTNVNEAPVFDQSVFNVSINETVGPQLLVLKLLVSDPDDNTVNDTFHLANVTVKFINSADFGNETTDLFLYVGEGVRTFFSTVSLNATRRNLYQYQATATDGLGLSSTAMVYINIIDVNSKPICFPATFQQSINILDGPDTVIQELACYDTDIDPLNVYLDYKVMSGDPDGYFNVSEAGAVVVQKKLPRTRLYGDRSATLMISVSDRGSPSKSTNVTVSIFVDNSIPATCSPVVTPPNIWFIGECATVTMDCQDPTISGTEHLVYTLGGNYAQGFEVQSNVQGTIVLCYTKTTSASYQLTVEVDNGLSVYSRTLTIEVSYLQATPRFNTTKFERNINEDAAVGVEIISIQAKSDNLIGQLVYRVLDSESFDGWPAYFSLNTSTGSIKSNASLRPLADQLVTLRIEAEDTGSRLKSSTQVEIQVIDINEEPVCVFTNETLSLNVATRPGTTIVNFSCTDVDTKTEYKQLNYQLTGDTDYFAFQDALFPMLILIQQALHITTASYNLQMTVSDSAGTPLTFQKSFQIAVNLVPPPVLVEAVALNYNLVRVNWRYEREAYKNVTNSYKVILTKTDGTEITSGDLAVTLKNYNMTQLSEKTTFTVIVMANTRYGTTNSSAIVLTTPEIPKLTNFTGTIRIPDIEYSPDLRGDSQLYQRTRKTVLDSLEFVLKPTQGFTAVDLRGFRDANSIFADFIVFVNQSGSVSETIRSLNSSVQSGWLDSLSVDSGYFIASIGDGYILIDVIRQSSPVLINGSSVTLTCDIIKIGYASSTEFEYWWMYNGNRIFPTSQSRYQITVADFTGFPEYAQTVLKINPILDRNAGEYKCLASVMNRDPVIEKSTTISVLSQPTVIMVPLSQTVDFGDNVTVTCQLVTPRETFQTFNWYRNGATLELKQGETVSQTDETLNTLSITGIRNSTVFGCAGVNDAGTGQTVYTHVGVLPTDATDEDQCESNTDFNSTLWETAAIRTTSTQACPQNYTGTITRSCSSEGDWQEPLYDCVNNVILALSNDVKDIQDGSSSVNLEYVLDRLAIETSNLDLLNGDIDTILESLRLIVQITGETQLTEVTARSETNDLIQIASNMIAQRNKDIWLAKIQQENVGAIDIPGVVENFLDEVTDYLGVSAGNTLKITRDYVYTEVGKDTRDQRQDYRFPDRSGTLPDWLSQKNTEIFVPADAFRDFQQISFSGSFYKNITSILVKTLKRNGKIEDVTSSLDINADIVSFNVKEDVGTLDLPARITFEHFYTNYSNPLCVFWDFTESAFSTDGCRVASSSDEQTVCECFHLTNFAVLMSPGKTPKADVLALSIISAVGCGISILCLCITIILHLVVWRLVKSDRAVLLMNLCIALIISYVLFLGGIDRAESEDVCTVISVLLHFFYLVVFFLMLAYGIEIAVSVIYVFVTRSRIRWLLPLAWGIPAVIVGISVGATQLDGYGNEQFCWLSIDSGLLWAFVGPAAFVILINVIIVIAVFRKMLKSSAMMTKSDKEKAKTGVRSICVLLPILGLTWVFGIFSVNEELVAFQYIFTVCNSLQGFFILLFHCIFNYQLRDALQHRSARKKSLASFENSYKIQQSTTTSTSFHSDKSTKQNNSELEIPNSSTNPFLEADRQMKEMVAKTKKGGNINDNLTNNKVDKNKPASTVYLDDVKISNILRESEGMGDTAGISSILQTQTTENELETVEIKHGEGNSEQRAGSSGNNSYNNSYTHTDNQPQQPKPDGYERLLQQQPTIQYDKLQQPYAPQTARSFDDVDAEIQRIREWEKEKEREKERKRLKELEKAKEQERLKEIERHKEIERQRQLQRQKDIERQKDLAKQKEIEKQKDRERKKDLEKQKDRERQKDLERKRQQELRQEEERATDPYVIKFDYQPESVYQPVMRNVRDSGEGTYDRKHRDGKSSRSSRSDDDYEGSAQNISSIKTALPMQYDAKRPQDSPKKTDTKKKDKKKKTPVKDRSRAYEYPYDSTYLGGSSRHSSLENMNMQQYGYSPYSQMPGMGGYQTGRPTHQQVHWDQYRYPRGQPRGDYW